MDRKERKRRDKPSQNQGEGEGPRKGKEEMRQDEAPPIDETRLREALRKNHYCIGVKRGKRYQCGGETNEDAKSKAVELLDEAVKRMLRWRVWETWWIEEWMDEWLIVRDKLEIGLRGKYNNEVVNDLLRLVGKFIGYNEQFLNYWREIGNEVKRLVDDLMSGKAEVIIWNNASGISVHGEHVTLEVNKTNAGGIPVKFVLEGLEGMVIEVLDVFKMTMSEKEYERFVNEILMMLKGGFEETDGHIDNGYAAMGSTQVWQVIAWSLLYPGEVHMYVNAINVNEGDVTATYFLRSSHDPLKGKILSNADKLSKDELLAFMFTAILGDGNVMIENIKGNDEAVIRIAMSSKKFDVWKPVLDKLRERFRWSKNPSNHNNHNANVVHVVFFSSYAIDLARAMISILPPILRDVLDALGFEKWSNLRRIAEMEVKWRRGESQVIIVGYRFTVNARKDTVALAHWTRDDDEVKKVISALRARYGDGFVINVHKGGGRLAVAIPMYMIEKYDDIKEQVIHVLCRKLQKTKDEEKSQAIIKHLRRLAPTKGGGRGGLPKPRTSPKQAQVI